MCRYFSYSINAEPLSRRPPLTILTTVKGSNVKEDMRDLLDTMSQTLVKIMEEMKEVKQVVLEGDASEQKKNFYLQAYNKAFPAYHKALESINILYRCLEV